MIFQDKTDGLVLNNVTGKVLSKIVKIMLAVDLVFTVPIVLSAPRRLIERALIPAVRMLTLAPCSCSVIL